MIILFYYIENVAERISSGITDEVDANVSRCEYHLVISRHIPELFP